MKHKKLTPKARLFLVFVIALVLLFAWLISYVITSRVEIETKRTVENAIPIQDMGWVHADIDGMVVRLSGDAPTDEARFRVVEAVSNEINVSRIENKIVAPEMSLEEPELTVEIVQNSHMSSIMGLLPKEPSPVPLYYALERATPDTPTLNMVQNLEASVDDTWEEKVDYLAFIVDNLQNAKISANEERVVVETVVPDDKTAEEIKELLMSRAPDGYQVELDVTAPRPLIAPFVFTIENNGDEAIIEDCSATDEEDLQRITNVLPDLNSSDFEDCKLGLGAPTDDWGLLISQLIKEVEILDKNKLSVRDNQVKLQYSDQEDQSNVDTASSRIRSSLPPGFGFEAREIVTVKSLDELQADGDAVVFNINKNFEGDVELSGVLSSKTQQNNISSLAAAKFGTNEESMDFEFVSDLPPSWEKNIFATINAISRLSQGSATLTDNYVIINGTVDSEENKEALLDRFQSELGDIAVQDDIDVTVAIVSKTASDPTECLARIDAAMAENPIKFEPSSSRISGESLNTITAISQILYECRDHAFEIGGHTDSKGSEDVNQRISEDRANSVLDAILETALDFGPLTAKGYGESDPIATNDTEEGRAQNRRIEIRIAPAGENS